MKSRSQPAKRLDTFKLNREIAYKDNTGKKREDFCIDYIWIKKRILKELKAEQLQTVSNNGEKITCQKGCSYCCLLYVQASLQECEAIVYYLYHNEAALSIFLGNYTGWRKKLRQNGDIFKKCAQLWLDKAAPGASEETSRALEEEAKRYQEQNLPCPFLHNNLCLIYEVRPYTCAGMVATTSPECCNPASPNKPKVYQTRTPAIIDNSFYYRQVCGTVLAFMPLVVYGILKDGYKLISNIPGLEGLEIVAMHEPEVEAIVKRYSTSSQS